MVQLFADFKELHGSSPSDILNAARDPQTSGRALVSLSQDLVDDAKKTHQNTEGDIQAITTAPHHGAKMCLQLGNIGQVAAGCLTKFGTAAQTFDKGVEKLNHKISTSGLRDPSQPDVRSGSTETIQQNVKNSLEPDYRALVKTLDKEAGDTATLLKHPNDVETVRALIDGGFIPLAAATNWPNLHLTDEDRAKYYTATMKDMSPADRAKYLIEHKEISGKVVDLILAKDPTTAKELGTDVSKKISGIDKDSSDGDVRDVTALLNRFGDSGVASAAILQATGAKTLISALSLAGIRIYNNDRKTTTDFTASLRTMFRSGEPVLATQDPEASRDLARDLVKQVDLRNLDATDEDVPLANRPVALSYLLRGSTLSTPFLDTMGDELEHLERTTDDFHWRQSTMGSLGVGAFFDPDHQDAAWDPMASYMDALGHNGKASLQFFDAGGDNPYGSTGDDRQKYWIGHRLWSHDDFDGLTSALDAATTNPSNLSDPTTARDAASLMSNATHLLAERSSVDWGSGHDGESFDPGNVDTAGTKHVAHMLTTYMPAIDKALADHGGDHAPGLVTLTGDRFGAGLADQPLFDGAGLKTLADVAVSTDDGFNDMRQGLNAYQTIQLQNSIHDHGRVDDQTSQADAKLEGLFVNAVGDTKIADAADQDARVQSWIDMGKDVVGEIPVPGGKVVEFLASHAIDAGADSLSDHYANNEDTEVDSENNYATAALRARHEAAQNALVNAGVIKPSEVAHQLTTVPNTSYTREQVENWFPDGKFPTQAQYNAMSPQDRASMRDALATIVDDRGLNDIPDYDQTYQDMFSKYFEKGDGDGN
ncbi:DUF6571 family protein [Nocardioides sp. DS6]|uniref:DUF6571 family protein n=1 Tax=Nocardioides eburneus TaxID=3231482 RepID=A0ABV3T1F0_9ACTN